MAAITGTDFVRLLTGKSQATREEAAGDMFMSGHYVKWPMVAVPLTDSQGRKATINVSSDYFAIGTPEDFVYLPLTPITAQLMADRLGLMLPTRKIVKATWDAASVKAQAYPMRADWERRKLNPDMRMITLDGFVDHDKQVKASLSERTSPAQLVAGTKKDVVISNKIRQNTANKLGSVAIYGWQDKGGSIVRAISGNNAKAGDPIQGLNPSDHDNAYVDYSHGIRFIESSITLDDGRRVRVDDPSVASLVSDEGPLTISRYTTPKPPPSGTGGSGQNVAYITPLPGGGGSASKTGGNLLLLSTLGAAFIAIPTYIWYSRARSKS